MVKRKYIKSLILYILFLSFLILNNITASAESWLPEQGTYQYSCAASTIDKRTKKSKNERSSFFVETRDVISSLYSDISSIFKQSASENRALRNSEILDIEQIKDSIKELEEGSEILSSFKDEHFAQCQIEYGATPRQSFGVKLDYIMDKFSGYNNPNHNKQFIGKNIDIFYKYQFFKGENSVATIKPMIEFSSYDNKNSCKFFDLAIFYGYSKKKKFEIIVFQELGVGFREYFPNAENSKFGYMASAMDGLKFNNGVSLTNFVQYEKSKLENLSYSHTLYEQISISKEFQIGKRENNKFTTQIGYFWKSSLYEKSILISGPVISVWFNA